MSIEAVAEHAPPILYAVAAVFASLQIGQWLPEFLRFVSRIYCSLKNWLQVKRFQVRDGQVAYGQRLTGSEPQYFVCPRCYTDAKLRHLNPLRGVSIPDEPRYAIFECPECENRVIFDVEEPVVEWLEKYRLPVAKPDNSISFGRRI